MTHSNNNTLGRKEKHLSYAKRAQIAVLKKEDNSNRRIADVIGCVAQSINNEIHCGRITQLKRQKQKGKIYYYHIKIYDADAGQAAYDKHRLNCGRRPK